MAFYRSDYSHHFYDNDKPTKHAIQKWAYEIARRQGGIPTIDGNIAFQNKLKKLEGSKQIVKPWSKKKDRTAEKQSLKKSLSKVFKRFCENTTIHGVKYLSMSNQHWSERIIWILLVSIGFAGMAYISYLLQLRFSGTPLATVVESTIYPVSLIPYPSITICNYHRVDWRKVEMARQKHIPNADNQTVQHFYDFLKVLSTLEYGSFDEFSGIQEWNLTVLEKVDLLQLYSDVSWQCDELFANSTCWWRNKYLNCCDLFHPAKSEYGLCLSFNSALSDVGKQKLVGWFSCNLLNYFHNLFPNLTQSIS